MDQDQAISGRQPSARDAATPIVSAFYDRFPYPGDPLQDGPPPGYNWRWCVDSVVAAVRGFLPLRIDGAPRSWRILDAGCGTGVSTDYLCHLNPGSDVLAVDISAGALEVARERLRRSGAANQVNSLQVELMSLMNIEEMGQFDYINSVGVLHHLDQPGQGLKALADRLAPTGILHLFLYADAGRWEIHRVQKALGLLKVGASGDGLRMGRALFRDLPSDNRLRLHHETRWALDTSADANFADMYLHPQETSYDLTRLFAFARQGGLHFCGFSNPAQWDPARLLQGELLARARALPLSQQWELVESLDPDISHFEFFLSPEPITALDWNNDELLLAAPGERNRCIWGWPSTALLGPDLEPMDIEPADLSLLEALDQSSGALALGDLPLAMDAEEKLRRARRLIAQRLLHPLVR